MRTSDFTAAPRLAQARAMVTISTDGPRGLWEVWRAVRGSTGLVRRTLLVQQGRPAGVIAWFSSQTGADSLTQLLDSRRIPHVVQHHEASPRGYTNGIWRAEDNRMAHVRRFSPLAGEAHPPRVSPVLNDGSALHVVAVRSRSDLRRFTRLPEWDLRRRTHGVPLWESTIRTWFRGTGPHTAHGTVELFLVEDGAGRVRGRTTLHTDDRMDRKLGEPTLLMGATDFADRDALAAMVNHAEREARARGRTRLLGPVSLLPNQVGGVVTAGHEYPGFLDGPWNPEHHPRDWEALGFHRLWEGATWRCEDLAGCDSDSAFPHAAPPPGVTLHHGRRRHLTAQLPILRRMLNSSFQELDYFTPVDAPELAAQTDGLAHLLDERLLLWLEDTGGEPLAFVLGVPDLTSFVRKIDGRDTPWNLARLWLTRNRSRRDAILIIKGTVPNARGRGLMSALSRELLSGLQAGGYQRLSVTFIEDDNRGSAAQFKAMGGQPLHRTTFYTKQILPDSAPPAGSPAARILSRAADWGRAPSAHNTQPWVVRADGPETLLLSWDPDRALPLSDPSGRDLMLSLGAVAEAIRIVATAEHLVGTVHWQVRHDLHHAAKITLENLSKEDPPRGTVAELLGRQTARGAYRTWPSAAQIAEISGVGLSGESGLGVVPDELVDRLLPIASGHALCGPGAPELAAWLRPNERHPRHGLDGLSARELSLSAAQARAIARLASMPRLRRPLQLTGLDRQLARFGAASPRGTVVALYAPTGLSPAALGELGGVLLESWLELGRRGWSVHPLSELLDHPGTAAQLHRELSSQVGTPVTVYAVWRCGSSTSSLGRSPRLTD